MLEVPLALCQLSPPYHAPVLQEYDEHNEFVIPEGLNSDDSAQAAHLRQELGVDVHAKTGTKRGAKGWVSCQEGVETSGQCDFSLGTPVLYGVMACSM